MEKFQFSLQGDDRKVQSGSRGAEGGEREIMMFVRFKKKKKKYFIFTYIQSYIDA